MPEKIVVLDGYTTSPHAADASEGSDGDVSWDALRQLGEVTIYDRTPVAQVVERAQGASVVLTNKAIVNAEAIAALSPTLRYVGVLATGYNVVDIKAAQAHDVVVANAPGYSTTAVAQHVFAMALHFSNHIAPHADAVADGNWVRSEDFCFTLAPLTELAGKTIGIVGLGAIGQQVARIATAFGMHVMAAKSPSGRTPDVPGADIDWQPMDTVFANADVLTLHCPLTDATQGLVNADRLATMKQGTILINTGRGPLIDEQALADALKANRVRAALDVLSSEPPKAENPLLDAPNCIITPHIAWASVEARQRLMDIAVGNIKAFLDGQPTNVVS